MNIGTQVAIQVATQAAAAQSRLLQQLEQSGAHSAGTAVELDIADQGERDLMADLVRRGRVRIVGSNRFYLGESTRMSTRQRVLTLACGAAVLALAALLVMMLERRPSL